MDTFVRVHTGLDRLSTQTGRRKGNSGGRYMYIGLGTVVLIVVIILVILMLRRG
jgi:septal ring-binding cell division protein DamX